MSKTSIARANGVRDSTEQRVTENYAATLARNLYDKEVESRTAAIIAAVAAEAALRAAADTLLQTSINNEASERQRQDGLLDAKISNEATERTNEDTALQAQIDGNHDAIEDIQYYISVIKQNITDLLTDSVTFGGMLDTLNGDDTVTGSVDKKVKDAINAFATAITADGTVNTYKEVLDWISAHGSDFAALVAQVNTNTGRITDETDARKAGDLWEEVWESLPTGFFGDMVTVLQPKDNTPLGSVPLVPAFNSGYSSIAEIAAAVKAVSDTLPTSASIAALTW